jgi:hypothetical protein
MAATIPKNYGYSSHLAARKAKYNKFLITILKRNSTGLLCPENIANCYE